LRPSRSGTAFCKNGARTEENIRREHSPKEKGSPKKTTKKPKLQSVLWGGGRDN